MTTRPRRRAAMLLVLALAALASGCVAGRCPCGDEAAWLPPRHAPAGR